MKRIPPTIGLVGFDQGYRRAVTMAVPVKPFTLRAGNKDQDEPPPPVTPCCDQTLANAYALDFDFTHQTHDVDCNETDLVAFHVTMELSGSPCLWNGTITIDDYTFNVEFKAIQIPLSPGCAYDLTIDVLWSGFSAQVFIEREFTDPASPIAVYGDASGTFDNPCLDIIQMLGCEIS